MPISPTKNSLTHMSISPSKGGVAFVLMAYKLMAYIPISVPVSPYKGGMAYVTMYPSKEGVAYVLMAYKLIAYIPVTSYQYH